MFYCSGAYNCFEKQNKKPSKSSKMTHTIDKKSSHIILPEKKEISEKWYSEDDLNNEIIEAYKNFEKNLRNEIEKKLLDKQGLAKEVCEKIYHSLNAEKGIKCKKVYLRTNSLISFEAIVVIPEKAFLSDYFNKAYEISFKIAQSYQKSDFNFDFNFMPSNRRINATSLLIDGFNLSYERIKDNEQEVKSRNT